MTISRSLNFSLFQSTRENSPKEEVEVEEEDDDFDWGELIEMCHSVTMSHCHNVTWPQCQI